MPPSTGIAIGCQKPHGKREVRSRLTPGLQKKIEGRINKAVKHQAVEAKEERRDIADAFLLALALKFFGRNRPSQQQ